MWVLIDNYDSFTHILHDYLLQAGAECVVVRNDEVTVNQLIELLPTRLILSPGPGRPEHSGIMMAAIEYFYDKIPILGICLGHQALGVHYGCGLAFAAQPMHGKQSLIRHNGSALYEDVPNPMEVMRYHSLAIKIPENSQLLLQATAEDGTMMSFSHRIYPSTGIQFHPESIGTPHGSKLIANWAKV